MAHIKQVVEIKFKTKLTQILQYPYDQKMRFICIDIFICNASALALPPYETHFDAHAWSTLIAMHSASSQNALHCILIMKPSARQPATHCVVTFWKSPGVAVCCAQPIWALHRLVHFTYKLLSAAENKCSVQGSGGSRAVCQSGKTGFLGEIHKSIIRVRGERVWDQCRWGTSCWMIVHSNGHSIGQKKNMLYSVQSKDTILY